MSVTYSAPAPDAPKSRSLPKCSVHSWAIRCIWRATQPNGAGMSVVEPRLTQGTDLSRVTLEECRTQARVCVEESRKVLASPGICAAWLKLADHWLNIADRL